MSRTKPKAPTKIEWIIITAMLLVFGASMFNMIGKTQNYFNAYVPPDGQWLLYTLAALGAMPVAYYALTKLMAAVRALMALQKEKPADGASAEEKAAYLKKTKPHTLSLMLWLLAGMFLSVGAGVGMVALNAFASSPEREVAGAILDLDERSTSGSNNSRIYFCRVVVNVDDNIRLTMRERRHFCRKHAVGETLRFTKHQGALGLGFYRLMTADG